MHRLPLQRLIQRVVLGEEQPWEDHPQLTAIAEIMIQPLPAQSTATPSPLLCYQAQGCFGSQLPLGQHWPWEASQGPPGSMDG